MDTYNDHVAQSTLPDIQLQRTSKKTSPVWPLSRILPSEYSCPRPSTPLPNAWNSELDDSDEEVYRIPSKFEYVRDFDRSQRQRNLTPYRESEYAALPYHINNYNLPCGNYKRKGQQLHLFKPIYIAKETVSEEYSINSWDAGDEFEYINNDLHSSNRLILKHLRTMTTMSVLRSEVELDEETPLRLGVRDRGTVECCLLKCNIRYCYLIRQSDQDDRVFVLSVNQPQKTKETLLSHYLICINKCNNCFYMEHDKKVRCRFFPTFRALVHDERILESIPLSTPIDSKLVMYEDEMWQIDYNDLRIGSIVGVGEFGEVRRGQWKRKGVAHPADVAIKQLKLRDDVSNTFAQEIRTMKLLRNRYLVALFGIAVDPITNQKLLITEFMEHGDLKTWLKEQSVMPSNSVLIEYALQICLGMSHLERRNFTHRDLACRNVLLKGQHAKIADFGMSEIVEYGPYATRKAFERLPTRWTAPEIFLSRTHTNKSDVWSFGICLIEMWTKGDRPYSNIPSSTELISKVKQGYVHERPSTCAKKYYDQIIVKCLKKNPIDRSSFQELKNIIMAFRSNKHKHDSSKKKGTSPTNLEKRPSSAKNNDGTMIDLPADPLSTTEEASNLPNNEQMDEIYNEHSPPYSVYAPASNKETTQNMHQGYHLRPLERLSQKSEQRELPSQNSSFNDPTSDDSDDEYTLFMRL